MVQQLDKKKCQRGKFLKSPFKIPFSGIYLCTHGVLLGEDHLSKEENVQQYIEPESTDARVVEIDDQVTFNKNVKQRLYTEEPAIEFSMRQTR